MSNAIKELFQFVKEMQSAEKSVLAEEFQNATDNSSIQNNIVDEQIPEGELEQMPLDPNLLMDGGIFENKTVEQKKVMLIDYFSKLIDKVVIVRDHIDTMSFDSVVSSNVTINTTQLQFHLEELREKVATYIEDQFETDKYERALFTYLSFMSELELIVKLLHKQINKNNK